MRVSRDEIICFNSMLDPTPVFGLRAEAKKANNPSEYIEGCKKTMIEDGFFSEEGKPNESFAAAVLLLKEYKQAETYIIVNDARVALCKGKEYVIYLLKVGEKYEFGRKEKSVFVYALLMENTFLRKGDQGIPSKSIACQRDQWMAEGEQNKLEELLWLQKVSRNGITFPTILYHIGEEGYCYDMKNEVLTCCDVLAMRTKILQLFEIQINKVGEAQ